MRLVMHSLTFSSIGKALKLPDGWFVPTEFNFCEQFFSLFVGCGSIFAKVFPNMSQAR